MLLINASMLLYFPQEYQYQNQYQQIALAQKAVMTAMSPRSTIIIPATTQSLFLKYTSPILGIEIQYLLVGKN